MSRYALIEIKHDRMKFSAAHFTIFSSTHREKLHGHNYHVALSLYHRVAENGLSFDYRDYQQQVMALCDQLNQRLLLPENSSFLSLEHDDDYIVAVFNGQRMPFLQSDVCCLPVTNITLEELSWWFTQRLAQNHSMLTAHHIQRLTVKITNGPNHSGSTELTLS